MNRESNHLISYKNNQDLLLFVFMKTKTNEFGSMTARKGDSNQLFAVRDHKKAIQDHKMP